MHLGIDGRVLVYRPTGVARYLSGLLEQIFTGTTEGMPHWGLHGLRAHRHG